METFSINGFQQASYRYDAMGRQAIRTLLSPSLVTIHSIFDSEGRRIAEYDEASGTLIREYVWNGWDPIAVIEGGQIYFVRADHIGRPVFATNTSGTQVWSASYLPFGGVHTATGALPANRFPGQWFQSESGLHQNWMRDYDPTTGRYIQADPLGLIDGASVYGYVRQSPLMLIDPTGECPWCAVAVVTILVATLTPEPANAPGFCEEILQPEPWKPYVYGAAAGVTFGPGFWAGAEYGVGANGARIAPFGNRWLFPKPNGKWWERSWNNSNGKWPHYHRKVVKPGQTQPGPGQTVRRHRPWDSSPFDRSFWDRF